MSFELPRLPTLIPGVLPPSRETWDTAQLIVLYLPIFCLYQWFTDWYPLGKTSINSRFNLPGKFAWVTMESVTFVLVGYISRTLPYEVGFKNGFADLPGTNKLLIGLYVIHYLQRAVIAPVFLQPSIAPIHVLPWLMAVVFNILNAIQIGGWVSGYGIVDNGQWAGGLVRVQVGLMIFCLGFFSNIFHDDELREIRRRAKWEQEQKEKEKEKGKKAVKQDGSDGKEFRSNDRVYKIPQNLGFEYILYPHYVSEWIEWAGYWMIGGSTFMPARSFVLFEISTMLPRAVQGKRWYIEKFGKENVGNKKAVIPFIGP